VSDAKDPALELAITYESETDAFARARLRWQTGSDVLEAAREALHPTPAAAAPLAELVDPERDAAAAEAWAAYTAAEAGFPRARILAAAGSELLQRGQELAGK
jgi:hypothetical protein